MTPFSLKALTGFGNSAIVTISVLFIIAEVNLVRCITVSHYHPLLDSYLTQGIAQTGSMALISQYVLGDTKGVGAAQARLMIPLTVLSAFTNNTPLTALMIPGTASAPPPFQELNRCNTKNYYNFITQFPNKP